MTHDLEPSIKNCTIQLLALVHAQEALCGKPSRPELWGALAELVTLGRFIVGWATLGGPGNDVCLAQMAAWMPVADLAVYLVTIEIQEAAS